MIGLKRLLSKVEPQKLVAPLTLVVLCIIISLASPYFLTARNFANLGKQTSVYLLIALGQTVVILSALYLLVGFSICANDALGSPVMNSGYVDVPGGKLYYDAIGEGQPLVMIHDGLLHRKTWDYQFAKFQKYHRVIRYDRRGYGESSAPEGPYSNEDDLLRVLDRFGLERAVLMGMSSGGGLAIDFALAHPERVKSLVLVGAIACAAACRRP